MLKIPQSVCEGEEENEESWAPSPHGGSGHKWHEVEDEGISASEGDAVARNAAATIIVGAVRSRGVRKREAAARDTAATHIAGETHSRHPQEAAARDAAATTIAAAARTRVARNRVYVPLRVITTPSRATSMLGTVDASADAQLVPVLGAPAASTRTQRASPFHAPRVSKPEAAALLQRAVSASSTPRAKSARGVGSVCSSRGGSSGSKSARSGGRFPLTKEGGVGKAKAQAGNSSARSEPRRHLEQHYIIQHDAANSMTAVSPLSSPLRSMRLSELADEVVYVPPGELYRLRNEYEEKLARQRAIAQKAEEDLEESERRQGEMAHREAMVEITRHLTRLRQTQRQQLGIHNKMHEVAEAKRAQHEARELNNEKAMRDALRRTRAETKASVEAAAAAKIQAASEKQSERERAREERAGSQWQRRLDEVLEQWRLDKERADDLERQLEAARAETSAARAEAERLRREKTEALKHAAAKAAAERNAAIAYEQHRAEQQRQQMQLHGASRADVLRLKMAKAEEIASMASRALRIAEAAKLKAEGNWEEAEAQRVVHEVSAHKATALRLEASAELERARQMSVEATEQMDVARLLTDSHVAALEEAKAEAAAERDGLQQQLAQAQAEAQARIAEFQAAVEAAAANEEAAAADESMARRMGRAPPVIGVHTLAPTAATILDVADGEAAVSSAEVSMQLTKLSEKLAASELQRNRLRSSLAEASSEQKASLRRLREAYRTRIHVRPLNAMSIHHSMQIAASVMDHDSGQEALLLPSRAFIGVVCGFQVDPATATTVGLGADGANVEALVFQCERRSSNPFEKMRPLASPGRSARGGLSESLLAVAAVAVMQGAGRWVIKYVWDEPNWDDLIAESTTEVGPASFGERQVTIASKEGLVISRGMVDVQPRPTELPRSTRYDFRGSKAAAMRLQAAQRGKLQRRQHADRMMQVAQQAAASADTQAGFVGPPQNTRAPSTRQQPAARDSPFKAPVPTATGASSKVTVPALPVGTSMGTSQSMGR